MNYYHHNHQFHHWLRLSLALCVLAATTAANSIDTVSRITRRHTASADAFFSQYRSYEEITTWSHELQKSYPSYVSLRSIGKSHEGRDIWAFNVSLTAPPGTNASANDYYVQAGLHAREWISVCAALYFAEAAAKTAATGAASVDKSTAHSAVLWRLHALSRAAPLHVHVVPLVNPDGYEYSRLHDRGWRANRNPFHAVDLNRNFPVAWGGLSTDQIDQHPGQAPGSEPEIIAVTKYFGTLRRVLSVTDMHSYGQYVVYPPGWKLNRETHGSSVLSRTASRMTEAIHNVTGKNYHAQASGSWYPVSGDAESWFFMQRRLIDGVQTRPLTITIELRPSDHDIANATSFPSRPDSAFGNVSPNDEVKLRQRLVGFILSDDEILGTCSEAAAAIAVQMEDSVTSRIPHNGNSLPIYGSKDEDVEDNCVLSSQGSRCSLIILS